jgi:hypothetical protein
MSSLAFCAAPVNESFANNSNGPIDNKRISRGSHNKTVKSYGAVNSKIESMKREIGFDGMDNDESENMGHFSPPDRPESAGVQRRNAMDSKPDQVVQPHAEASSSFDAPVSMESFQSLPSIASEQYYNQFVPYYDRAGQGPTVHRDELIDKLDYMIHLLEDQREIKTGSVTEEIILYSFLGVFIIFVLDSFARAGKYTR